MTLFAGGYGSDMFFYTCGVNQFWIIVFFTAVCEDLQSYKSQSPLQREIFLFLKIPFQELQRMARLDYKVVFLYLWYHKNKSRLRKFEWLGGWGERLVEHCTFQNRNPVRVFLYHCISDGNQLFSENFGCRFHFILHVMSDKAAFVSGAVMGITAL